MLTDEQVKAIDAIRDCAVKLAENLRPVFEMMGKVIHELVSANDDFARLYNHEIKKERHRKSITEWSLVENKN